MTVVFLFFFLISFFLTFAPDTAYKLCRGMIDVSLKGNF